MDTQLWAIPSLRHNGNNKVHCIGILVADMNFSNLWISLFFWDLLNSRETFFLKVADFFLSNFLWTSTNLPPSQIYTINGVYNHKCYLYYLTVLPLTTTYSNWVRINVLLQSIKKYKNFSRTYRCLFNFILQNFSQF